MAPSIEVDAEVYAALQRRAQPFIDCPNDVLRRLLGIGQPLDEAEDVQPGIRTLLRARKGDLLPEREYEMPILRYLARRGGEAPASDVISAVGEEVRDRLTDADKTLNSSGLVRWQNRVQFARLTLVQNGQLAKSPRGIWRISNEGKRRLESSDC